MASIRERTATGGETTWAVLYRHGGRQTSTTFEDESGAVHFKALVDLLGPDKALREIAAQAGETGLTVEELFGKWIEWKATTDVTARTIKDYRRDYTNWIRDRLGNRQADGLDELDVQDWVDWMTKRGLDPKSVGDRHMILGNMYRFGKARSRRLVDHNPCEETQLPSKKKKAPKGFSLTQWDALHAWAADHEPEADDLLLFFASTGWRWGEVTPRTPADVEDYGDVEHQLEDGSRVFIPDVFVSVAGVHRVDENDQVVYVEGEAKSKAGIRRINLPPEAARMVRRRMVGLEPSDLLFTNSRGGRWHAQNFLQREFAQILEGAGIAKVRGMGAHYLRHTHVAMLDRAKVGPSKMQRRIGHDNLSTTFGVYGGTIDNTLDAGELVRLQAVMSPDQRVRRQLPAGDVVLGEVVTVKGEVAP
jgi:integrase